MRPHWFVINSNWRGIKYYSFAIVTTGGNRSRRINRCTIYAAMISIIRRHWEGGVGVTSHRVFKTLNTLNDIGSFPVWRTIQFINKIFSNIVEFSVTEYF